MFDNMGEPWFSMTISPVIALFVMVVSIGVAWMVDQNKYTRLVLFGR